MYGILTHHIHNSYKTWQYITQYFKQYWTTNGFISRINVVICFYSLALPRFYNAVFGGKSAWLWLKEQSTQPYYFTSALLGCVIFFIFCDLFKECLDFVSWLLNYCRGIFARSDKKSADFASNLKGRLVEGSLHVHTPCVFIVMRHVSRLTA